MTNESGLEFDKQAQYDVTKEEALKLLNKLTTSIYTSHSHYMSDVNKLKQYIEERP